MNAKQRRSSSGAMIKQWTIACFAIAIATVGLSAADELVSIDFRNRIPEVVDAPVFDFDGASGLDWHFFAQLYVGPDMDSLTPWGGRPVFVGNKRRLLGLRKSAIDSSWRDQHRSAQV